MYRPDDSRVVPPLRNGDGEFGLDGTGRQPLSRGAFTRSKEAMLNESGTTAENSDEDGGVRAENLVETILSKFTHSQEQAFHLTKSGDINPLDFNKKVRA